MLPVSAEIRSAAGVAAGDEVDIDIDTEPRELSVPTDLTDALGSDADSKQFVAGWSYGNKRRMVLPIDGATSAGTRERRIVKAISALREGKISLGLRAARRHEVDPRKDAGSQELCAAGLALETFVVVEILKQLDFADTSIRAYPYRDQQ